MNLRSPTIARRPGIIIVKTIEHPEPVNAIVDFQPLERTEAVVRLDEIGRNCVHAASVDPARLHPVAHGQRTKKGRRHKVCSCFNCDREPTRIVLSGGVFKLFR